MGIYSEIHNKYYLNQIAGKLYGDKICHIGPLHLPYSTNAVPSMGHVVPSHYWPFSSCLYFYNAPIDVIYSNQMMQ